MLRGDDVDLDALARPDDVAERRRAVHHAAARHHARSRLGRAQHRLYRMQRIGPRETAMHWQVHKTGARHFRRAKELGKAARGGGRVRRRSRAHLRRDRAAARRDRRVDVRRLSCASRRCEHVAARPSTSRCPTTRTSCSKGTSIPSEPMCDEGPFGDHTGYYTPVDAVPAVPRHGADAPARRGLPGDARRPSADGGRVARQGHRAPLPAAAPDDRSRRSST